MQMISKSQSMCYTTAFLYDNYRDFHEDYCRDINRHLLRLFLMLERSS